METKDITLEKMPQGKETKLLGNVACQWDKQSFELGKCVKFKFFVDNEGTKEDVTDSIIVTRTTPREGTTSQDGCEIVFKNVELEIQQKAIISKWKESE